MSAPLSRLMDEQPTRTDTYPPLPGCPGWCTFHAHGVCQSADQVIDGVSIHMLRTASMTVSDVWVNGIPWTPLQAIDQGRTFARLGHAELAAHVTRLGETAIAEAAVPA